MNRRDFLRVGVAGGALALSPFASTLVAAANQGRVVAILTGTDDPVSATPAVARALGRFHATLEAAGLSVVHVSRLDQAPPGAVCLIVAGAASRNAADVLRAVGTRAPEQPESLAFVPATLDGREVLLITGADARGLIYAVLDVADRVSHAPATEALRMSAPVVQTAANPVRSVMRQFTSDVFDTPWLFDRGHWTAYLSMLATQRFNRLHLAFGLGYDTLRGVTDSYLLFLYPFLVNVPGYPVSLSNFTDADRARHLDMLKFISDETVAHGLDFQLGVWMHGYEMPNSPRARHVVSGLTSESHAPYCRDALAAVLRACPSISSVALRIHGESGIAEGSYDFWKTVFAGVPLSGRRVEIDLHAKGLDQTMIDHAVATGMPVAVSPKYWAEHLGMPYHQAAVRDLEMPVAGRVGAGLMTISEGARVFTRYGYADLLRDDRQYTVRHRVFAGTQRLLLSGDPHGAASYSRMFQFCGSTGADLMEPLTCRGRRGTGDAATRRSGYVDGSLEPTRDWQKYEYWYRTWGRLLYSPDAPSEAWQRQFASHPQGRAIESALANATRILPIITTAHLPSAACDAYWPEVYWNQPLADVPRPNPYGDTPAPRTFQHVSPLDPQLFSSMDEHAAELLGGDPSGKYSPTEVAGWLDGYATAAERDLAAAGALDPPDLRRVAIDVGIQVGLGRFFAQRFRSGVLYALHERTGDRRALEASIARYRLARDAYAGVAALAAGVYAAELAASDKISNRGQWADRLPAIDADIQQLSARLATLAPSADSRLTPAILAAGVTATRRGPAPVTHVPVTTFRPGQPLPVAVRAADGHTLTSVRLFYRHVNQAERFEQLSMSLTAGAFTARIPSAYTESPYPLQYYIVVKDAAGRAWIAPGFDEDLSNLPYVIVRRA